ncbi:putative Sulfotransferase domain, P-loop containing nucleoside triphosphate hydrolase [Dioscorea sansibarensis]
MRVFQCRQYQGFWFTPNMMLPGLMAAQDHFIPHPSDILMCTPLKVGTTWLKALAFATLNRNDQPCKQSLLLSHNPHVCVPNLEFRLNGKICRRLLLSHPRENPKDTFVSYWHFFNKIIRDVHCKVSLGDAFDAFLKEVHSAGPLWDHLLGFWNAGVGNPVKVLFMKYEELKSDTAGSLRKLADFMGYPFTEEEERDGILEKILDCAALRV